MLSSKKTNTGGLVVCVYNQNIAGLCPAKNLCHTLSLSPYFSCRPSTSKLSKKGQTLKMAKK